MVVTLARAVLERLTRYLAGGLQLGGHQLIEKRVGCALVHEQRVPARHLPDHARRVGQRPGTAVLSEVGRQRLLTPGGATG